MCDFQNLHIKFLGECLFGKPLEKSLENHSEYGVPNIGKPFMVQKKLEQSSLSYDKNCQPCLKCAQSRFLRIKKIAFTFLLYKPLNVSAENWNWSVYKLCAFIKVE